MYLVYVFFPCKCWIFMPCFMGFPLSLFKFFLYIWLCVRLCNIIMLLLWPEFSRKKRNLRWFRLNWMYVEYTECWNVVHSHQTIFGHCSIWQVTRWSDVFYTTYSVIWLMFLFRHKHGCGHLVLLELCWLSLVAWKNCQSIDFQTSFVTDQCCYLVFNLWHHPSLLQCL